MQTKYLFVLIHVINKGEVGTLTMFIPSSHFLTDRSKALLLLQIIFVICGLCLSVILSCLFLAALWSPAWEGLTSWFSCM